MEVDYLKDEPKLILTYPYKSKVSIFCYLLMVISFVISMLILKYLKSLRTDFSYMSIILIVLIYIPILLYLMVYPLFLNGVKLELYNEGIVKYYTYGSRGNSILHISFRLEDIGQIKIKKRPFDCLKLTMKIKDPIFYGLHVKKLNRLVNVSIITDRETADLFMKEVKDLN